MYEDGSSNAPASHHAHVYNNIIRATSCANATRRQPVGTPAHPCVTEMVYHMNYIALYQCTHVRLYRRTCSMYITWLQTSVPNHQYGNKCSVPMLWYTQFPVHLHLDQPLHFSSFWCVCLLSVACNRNASDLTPSSLSASRRCTICKTGVSVSRHRMACRPRPSRRPRPHGQQCARSKGIWRTQPVFDVGVLIIAHAAGLPQLR